MNSYDIQERKKKDASGEETQPDIDLQIPDANVGMDGECLVPPHPESVRPDTGEPCDDGRDGGKP
ncbi:MAG: hypothetical protein LIP28_00890 [Deltaproteobacteria bacterium]|nr:hypothetical protein [Deltaproteobacteria bacterium]